MQEGNIDRLRQGLYSRKGSDIIDSGRSGYTAPEQETSPGAWQTSEQSTFDVIASRVAHGAAQHHSLAKKIFFFSAGIFLLSLAVAGFVFWGGLNRISSQNVDIKVVGPVLVGGGEEVSLDVVITNNNNTALQNAKLTIEYPPGARGSEMLGEDLTSQSFDVGSIASGREITQSISFFLFGKKDEVKLLRATVDYAIADSNAKFFKEKEYEISISSAPIIVTAIYPKEVNANQEIAFVIEVSPNSADAPESFLVSVNYPFGFAPTGMTPEASFGNNTWKFDGLRQGMKRTITIRGTMAGQNNEERVFKITAGTPSEDDPRAIGVTFVSLDESIEIKRPFIGLDVRIGGSSGKYVARGTGDIQGTLRVQNNTREELYNVIAEVSFSGPAFSSGSVRATGGGFFRSIDNTILWDGRAASDLETLGPGDSDDLFWTFAPLTYASVPKAALPEIQVTIKVSGDRILASGQTERVESRETRTVTLASDVVLEQTVWRSGNGISNTGTVPPKANQKTTYTVLWQVSNSFNPASNVAARAVLPSYVEWTGVVSPSSEKITYNPASHEVVWDAGSIAAGTGFGTPKRQVAFQISFLPSTSQVGTAPELVGAATLAGIDKTTSVGLEYMVASLTTRFNDSSYKLGDELVVQ